MKKVVESCDEPAIKPKSKTLKLTRPEPKETDIQSMIMRALHSHPSVVWHARMNTGSGKLLHPGGQSRFIKFGFKGQPDILGQLIDGRVLAIEVKRPSGQVSADQQAFLTKAANHRAVAFVARSVSDVFERLDGVMRDQSRSNKNGAVAGIL